MPMARVVFASLCVATAALLPTRRARTPSLLSAKKTVWAFDEARDYARSFGFGSKDEYVEYRCPGAYGVRPVQSHISRLRADASMAWG